MSPLPAYRLPPRRSEGLPWGARPPSPGFALRRDPTPVRMIRGPSPKARRIVTSGCSTWNEPVNQLKSLERQFHVEQSQVLT